MVCIKVTTKNWDIRPSVTVKVWLTNILWIARQIELILVLGMVHTRVEVHRIDLEMSGLVEWPWLQLMCYTICLPHGCNFRWWEEVWDGSECWLVCHYWTLEIEFNKSLSLLIIRLANYSVTTSLIYKLIL